MNKQIYLVRHGESDGNALGVVQGPDTELSKEGLHQAERIGQRLSNLNFNLLLSSPFHRAEQTAQIISKNTGKEIEYSDLFIERRRPSAMLGLKQSSSEYISLHERYTQAFADGEEYEDGESFAAIAARAKKALRFLDEREEEKIVVVTHGMFLRMLCSFVILGDVLDAKTCTKFIQTLKTRNTGISIFNKSEKGWRLEAWNDHAHFAEY
ncbi:MAG: histidine phosphatase family protein [Candidatus Harrisonbacteria bacterium]|nr:histidine phosphatase family protein [Candidatus Harrisonbacteria bacterium]